MTRALHHLICKKPDPLIPGLVVPNLTLYGLDGSEFKYRQINAFAATRSRKSITTHIKVSRVMGLFWDYLLQSEGSFVSGNAKARRKKVMAGFINSLARGTFLRSPEGLVDHTGLFWKPLSPDVIRGLAHAFDVFVNHMVDEQDSADPFEIRCEGIFSEPVPQKGNRTAHEFGLLSHLDTQDENNVSDALLEDILGPDGRQSYLESATKAFPKELLSALLTEGFEKRKGVTETISDVDATGRLYARLLLGAGMRGCEPLHMLEEDFSLREGRVVAYVRHPERYRCPVRGKARIDVLREFDLVPRNLATDRYHAGWKNLLMDRSYQAKIRWLPGTEEAVEMALSDYILNVRTPIMRARRAKGLFDHPYLLISVKDNRATKTNAGDPWTVSATISSFKRAIGRLAKKYPQMELVYGREHGTTRHSTRHRYGKTLDEIGLQSKQIMVAMRHRSALSSLVYRIPDDTEISKSFDEAAQKIKDGNLDPFAGRHLTQSEALEQLVHITLRGGK